ncbi:MAG: right-handed parallel beta-helix repeat-containing protein [Candidatus Latescibacterota bacterium]|nr:MAG: right-handed parallel beta-helix repeat-containing protein [Candidatus Latescibacterota bacterium]
MRAAALVSIAIAASAVLVQAATLHVPLQYATIQPALDAASAGDTVLVAPGTYTGSSNRNLAFSKPLVVRSEAGPEMTTIDVEGNESNPGRGFLITSSAVGPETVLEGFTIRNGFMADSTAAATRHQSDVKHDLSGAGIMLRFSASPTIRNCIIRSCHSDFTGGGIGVEFGAAPRIENCVVTACTAGFTGGAISVETGAAPTLVGCTFTGNRAREGGGAHFGGAVTQVTSCLFAGNTGENRGGGVDAIFGTTLTLERSVVWNNCSANGADLFADPAIALPNGGALQLACSAVDTTLVSDGGGVIEWTGENVFTDPGFCDPAACAIAPTSAGVYGVVDSSAMLADNNACGEKIGPQEVGCTTAVEESSWGGIKSIYRR